jgi:hypothetical protein
MGHWSYVKDIVLKRLEAGEKLSYHCLIEYGLCKNSAFNIFRDWHKRRVIHIDYYKRNENGPATPYFAFGEGFDATPLRPLTQAQLQKRWRKRNPDAYLDFLSKVRAKRLAARPPKFDPLMEALLGDSHAVPRSPDSRQPQRQDRSDTGQHD